jgi:hypothetical protein
MADNPSRRTMMVYAPAAALMPAAALAAGAAPDPVFALIEEHRAAYAFVNNWGDDREGYDAAFQKEDRLLRGLLTTKATTIAGIIAFALYVSEYPDMENQRRDIGLLKAMRTIAAALRDIAARGVAA